MMMDQRQLELEFDETACPDQGAQVVEFRTFVQARERRKRVEEQASIIAAIVKSVEHITGRSPEAEAM